MKPFGSVEFVRRAILVYGFVDFGGSYPGGFGSGMKNWRAVSELEVPEEDRSRLGWLLNEETTKFCDMYSKPDLPIEYIDIKFKIESQDNS